MPTGATAERRRSPRLARTIAVELSWQARDGRMESLRGETEMISAYGALLRLPSSRRLPAGLTIKNLETGESSPAQALYSVQAGEDGAARIAVALETSGETFWKAPLSAPGSEKEKKKQKRGPG